MGWTMDKGDAMGGVSGLGGVRLGVDGTTGHGCFPPTRAASASMSVFIDQIAQVRVTDRYIPHCCPNQGCHAPVAIAGSRSVYVDQLQQQRTTDAMGCGDKCRGSSISTFSGI